MCACAGSHSREARMPQVAPEYSFAPYVKLRTKENRKNSLPASVQTFLRSAPLNPSESFTIAS